MRRAMNLDERMEEGWQRKLAKARAKVPSDLLSALELDPTLPFRGKYEKRCRALEVSEEDFATIYRSGVARAFYTDVNEFYPFTDIVFERVDEVLGGMEERSSDVA